MSLNIFQMRIHFHQMHINSKLFEYKSDPANVKRKILSRKECQKAFFLYNMVYNVKQKNKLNKIIWNNLLKWSKFYMNGSFWPMNALFLKCLGEKKSQDRRLK
jgi:hypothetical protein